MAQYRIFLILSFLALMGCGGGSSTLSIAPPPAEAPVNISLSTASIDFSLRQNDPLPPSQTVSVTWTDDRVAEIVAEFADGADQPAWLSVTKSGISSPVTFEFDLATSDLTPGTYTATLNLIAKDGARRTLVIEPVAITYEVLSRGSANRATQDDILHFGQTIILNGANIAWSEDGPDWYNQEIGTADAMGAPRTNITAFQNHFSTIAAAGGNSARIWLHTGATVTPVIEANGTVTGLSRELTDAQVAGQLDTILDAAWTEGILVTFNLFSFNMVCDAFSPTAAKTMLESEFQSYIDNALTPLVLGVKDHPAMFAWDIFNEPEGMSQANYFCPSTETVTTETVQNVVNQTAAAIHDLDPNVKVTSSTHTDLFDNYANSVLTALPGANPNGTLDFYSLHWYDTGWQVSPHITLAGEFMADRPVIVGEYDVEDTGNNGPSGQNSLQGLLDNGYDGAWPWALSTGNIPLITSAITEAAPSSTVIDKAAIEACIQDKPANCYTQ